MDEDILARHESDRVIDRIVRRKRSATFWLGVANAATLITAVTIAGVRAPAPRAVVERTEPVVERLTGPGPYLVYAVRDDERRPRVYAIQASGGPAMLMGEFPGILNDFAGHQGQIAGRAVPLLTVQSTVDQNTTTRLWLVRRDGPPQRIAGTSDLVAGFTISPDLRRLAIARRSVRSVGRGFFLHVQNIDGSGSGRIISLRRPNGESSRDALRPVGWLPNSDDLVLTPFCDQCAVVPTGLYRTRGDAVEVFPATAQGAVLGADISLDGRAVHIEQELPPARCDLPPDASARSQLLTCRPIVRLAAVDSVSGRIHEIARSDELPLRPPLVSPSGKTVVYASGRDREIEWRSVSSGAVLGVIDVPSANFIPAGWLDEDRFVALAFDDGIAPDRAAQTSLVLVSRGTLRGGGETGASLDVLATAQDLVYLGWLR